MSDTDDFAYQGAQDAGSAVHQYNVDDFHISQALDAVRTAHPCRVVRAPYDASGNAIPPGTIGPIGLVDVQPLVNMVDGRNGSSTPHGTVYSIPYFRYQSALGAVIADPVVGDIGEIVAHDRDTSVVRKTADAANPGSRRRHDLADGVYHGQHISTATPTQGVAFTSTGLKIFDRNGNTITTANNLITIRVGGATYTLDQNGNFRASGNVVAGQGGADQVGVQTHTHADPSEGNTGAPNAGT